MDISRRSFIERVGFYDKQLSRIQAASPHDENTESLRLRFPGSMDQAKENLREPIANVVTTYAGRSRMVTLVGTDPCPCICDAPAAKPEVFGVGGKSHYAKLEERAFITRLRQSRERWS